jgi:hypothetical protein
MEDESAPVACSLGQGDLAERTARWQTLAARALRQAAPTQDGVRLVFTADPGVADELESLVALERGCCAFAAWSVQVGPARLTLDVTADGEEAVTAVRSLFPGLGAASGAEGPVEARIQVLRGDRVAELAALWEWLRSDRDLAGLVRPVRGPLGETDLGGAYDLLAVALGSGGAGVALARSLTTWLLTRRPSITITVSGPHGSVTVAGEHLRDSDIMPLLSNVLETRDDR